MAGYGEPDWLSPGTTTNATQQTGTTPGITAPNNTNNNAISDTNGGGGRTGTILGLMSVGLMGLAAMMCALGVLTLIEVQKRGNPTKNLSEPFLAAYMVMFAVLLFCYEIMWWKAIPSLNKSMRLNFGFMYSLRGKGLYLIFVACLCLGLGEDAAVRELNWITGIVFLAFGCFLLFIDCLSPGLAQAYTAPTAGLTASTDPTNVV